MADAAGLIEVDRLEIVVFALALVRQPIDKHDALDFLVRLRPAPLAASASAAGPSASSIDVVLLLLELLVQLGQQLPFDFVLRPGRRDHGSASNCGSSVTIS